MIIRLLNDTDVAAFKAIRIEATQQAPTSVYQTPEEERARLPEQLQPQLIDPSTRIFGAFDGDQLLGIAGISRDGETKRSHTARIRLLYVRPTHRGQGLARQLLTKVLDYAAGVPQIRQIKLTVGAPNIRAQQLYLAFGFKTYATDPKVLCVDGQFIDENLMVLSMPPSTPTKSDQKLPNRLSDPDTDR
jgi:RimJ/RimL family protein N-acetyltransferase